MAQMSHPIKHDSLPRVPLCAHIRFAQNSFFVLRTKSSASMALTQKKQQQKNQNNNNKTKQPPPPKKKNKKKTTKKTPKKQQKNSNKQITKTDKTQQTNVALATARAYKICYKCVCILIILIYSEQHVG